MRNFAVSFAGVGRARARTRLGQRLDGSLFSRRGAKAGRPSAARVPSSAFLGKTTAAAMPESAKPMKFALSDVAASRQSAAIFIAVAVLLHVEDQSMAQGSRADYDRAASLWRRTSEKVFRDRIEAHWLTNNPQFWYEVRTGTDTREFVFVDAEKGERKPAFNHAKLAEALNKAATNDLRAENLPLRNFEWKTGKEVEFIVDGKSWRADLEGYSVTEQKDAKTTRVAAISPDDVPRASRRTGPGTSITFINRTRDEVELFWLNTEGARQSYGKLAAGAQREQHTFAAHVWLAVNERGRTVAAFEATEKAGDAEISNFTGGPARQPRGRRWSAAPHIA